MKKLYSYYSYVIVAMIMLGFPNSVLAQLYYSFDLELLEVEWVDMPLDGDECCGPVPWLPEPMFTLDMTPIMWSNGAFVTIPTTSTQTICVSAGTDQPTSGMFTPTSNNTGGHDFYLGGPDIGSGFDLCSVNRNFALNIVIKTWESDLVSDCEFSIGRPGDQDDDNLRQASAFMNFDNLADQPGEWKTTVFSNISGAIGNVYGGRFTFRFRYTYNALEPIISYKNTDGAPQSVFCEGDLYRVEAAYTDPQITGGYHLWEEWNGSTWIPVSNQHNNYIDVPIANPIRQYRVKQTDNPAMTCIYDNQDWIYSSAIPSPTIVPSPPPAASVNTTLNRTCPGNALSITLNSISGYSGTTSFKVTLTNLAGNTVGNIATYSNNQGPYTFNNLAADTYIIKVSSIANNIDGETIANCTTVKNLGLLSHYPDPILTAPTVTQPQCSGDPGQIGVGVTNGLGPHIFRLYDNNNTLLQSFTSALNVVSHTFSENPPFATSYYVKVTNPTGCSANSSTATITAPQPIAAAVSVSGPIKCKGETGTVLLNTIQGGTPPYSVSWRISGSLDAWTNIENGVTASSRTYSNFSAGSYDFRLVDANACEQVVGTAQLTEPAVALSIDGTGTPASACQDDGSINVTAAGGEGSYTFSIPGESNTTGSFTGLAFGTYDVSVTDNRGCTVAKAIAVGKYIPLQLMIDNQMDIVCTGDGNGSILVSAIGGEEPYIYSKDGTNFQSSPLFEDLDGGPITIIVEDASGCQTSLSTTIIEPETFLLARYDEVQPILCPGGMATVIIDITGRDVTDNPLMVSTNGGTGFISVNLTASNDEILPDYLELSLAPGNYDIVVKDQNDCEATGTIEFSITEPSQVTAILDSVNNISCFGADDGKIHIDMIGGTAPYTVNLIDADDDSQVQSTMNVNAGPFVILNVAPHDNYKVVVTDAHGCSAEISSIALITPDLLQLTLQNTGADIDCSQANGEITAMAVGGTPPYRYSLDNITFGPSGVITGATTSNTVYVRDAHNCLVQQTINIPATTFDPNPIVTILDPAIDKCQGAHLRIDFTPNGFEHNWKISVPGANCDNAIAMTTTGPSQTFFEVSDLAAGSYQICAVAGSCSLAPVPFEVIVVDSLKLEVTSMQHVLCFGEATGSVSLSASGGVGPYTITQNNADPIIGSTATYSSLSAGPKFYQVSDSKGCTKGISVTITQPNLIFYDQLSVQDAFCTDSTSASISFRPIGGNGTYSVRWRPIGGTYVPISMSGALVVLSEIGAGSYQFSITDANNCSKEYSFDVSEPPALDLVLSGISHITCNGANNGSITANSSGGTGTRTYAIDGGTYGINPVFSGLAPGPHTLHLKDDNGCEITKDFNINEPAILTADIQLRDVQCNGANDGEITITGTGGTPGYQYSLEGGPFQTSNMFTQLAPGTYGVVVNDANNCSVSINSLVITEPGALTSMATQLFEATCQNGGSALVTYGGGTGPYSVVWDQNPVINTDKAMDLAAGVHRVEITDAQGCVLLDTVNISTLGVPIIEVILIESPDCDDPSGRISVRVKGSTLSPFTYTIDGDTMSNGNFFGLAAGSHEVAISDSLGCRSARNIIVPTPPIPKLELVETVAEACGQKDGEITLSPSGGKAPYQLEIGGTILTGTTISRLTYGLHSVKITDDRNCSNNFSFMIDSVANPTATLSSLGEVCDRSNGQITVMPTSASSPFTFAWSHDTITTLKATKLSAGTYKVTVTNSRGCESVFEKAVQEIRGPSIVVQEILPASCGKQNGLIHVSVNSGGPGLNINWGHNQSKSLIQRDLAPGTYYLTITNANACQDTMSFVVEEERFPPVDVQVKDRTCAGDDGSIVIIPQGRGPFIFDWSHDASLQGGTATNLSDGPYSVSITDSSGCSISINTSIAIDSTLMVSIDSVTNTQCGQANGSIRLNAIGDNLIYHWAHDTTLTGPFASNLPTGNYLVQVRDGSSCMIQLEATVIDQGSAVLTLIDVDSATCGIPNGGATISLSGGSSPIVTKWFHLDDLTTVLKQGDSLNQVAAGSYQVVAEDANGCSTTLLVDIPVTGNLAISTEMTSPSCPGLGDGSATVLVMNNPQNLTYLWNDANAQTSATATNLRAGTYEVVVATGGCQVIVEVVIEDPELHTVDLEILSSPTCFGTSDGQIGISVTGGGSNLQYSWNGQETAPITQVENLTAGTYQLSVVDSSGCVVADSIQLQEPKALVQELLPASCGKQNGLIHVSVNSGGPGLNINWGHNQSNSLIQSDLAPGTYYLTITHASACQDTMSFVVEEERFPPVDVQVKDGTCAGDDGSIVVIPDSHGPFDFDWGHDTSLQGGTATNLSDGSYSVTITDSSGCSISIDTSIAMDRTLVVSIDSVANTQCGQANGSIRLNAIGDNLIYHWAHDTTLTGPFASNLPTGNYLVQVHDGSSCMIQLEATVTDQGSAVLTLIDVDSATCGIPNGGATISLSGGSSPIVTKWFHLDDLTTVLQQGDLLNQVAAGSYQVVAEDANGCSTTLLVDIPVTGNLAISTEMTSPSCPGLGDGSATALFMNNPQNLTYLWNDANAQTSATATNLRAGTYEVVVATGGCQVIVEVVIEDPELHTVDLEILSSPTCFGTSDGQIGISVTGGGSNLQYSWNGQETAPITQVENLTAGTYQLSVVDSSGCVVADSIQLQEPKALQLSVDFVNGRSCTSIEGGNAQIDISGGTGQYTVQWNDPSMQTSVAALDLEPGPVTVMVTDENQCTDSLVIEIPGTTEVLGIERLRLNQPSCTGDADGAIELQIPEGSGDFVYFWNDTISSTEPKLAGLIAGTYIFHVLDEVTGCEGRDTIMLSGPVELSTSLEVTNESCDGIGGDGSITATVTGGNGDYMYQWNDDQMQETATAIQLVGGMYILTITDAKGCQVEDTAVVQSSGVLSIDLGGDQVILCEGEQHYVELPDSAGITYYWSGPNGFSSTESSLYLPGEGLYTVEVQQSGCISRDTVMVTSTAESLNALFVLPTQVVLGDTVVAIEVSWPAPDAIDWFFDDQSIQYVPKTNNTHYFVFSNTGTFEISLQSTIGNCIDFITKSVLVAADSASFEFPLDYGNQDILELDLAPNPNNGLFSVFVKLSSVADVFVQINNALGGVVETRRESGSKEYKMDFNLDLQPGLHAMTIQAKSSRKTLIFLVH